MKSGRFALFVSTALALLAVACEQPDSTEEFIKAGDAERGLYSFVVALDDSLCTYDFSFYTRIDRPEAKSSLRPMELSIVWNSPSGQTASETVYMNPAVVCEKYRSGVSPKETGTWRINVRIVNEPKGLRGLGLICERNGTR